MDVAACKKLFDLCSQSLSSTEVGFFLNFRDDFLYNFMFL